MVDTNDKQTIDKNTLQPTH